MFTSFKGLAASIDKANDLFFQLNYNWNKEEIIKDYGEVTLDSVTYNFVSIYLDKNIQLNPLTTYKFKIYGKGQTR